MEDRVRREGSQALTACAGLVGARRYLFQSIVWVARPVDESAFDETSLAVDHPLYNSAADGEAIAFEAGVRAGFEVSVLRCGAFYAAPSMRPARRLRL